MPQYRIRITDTITYSREAALDIEADDETVAEEIAREITMTHKYPPQSLMTECAGQPIDWDEEETDNTPWEIAVEPLEAAHAREAREDALDSAVALRRLKEINAAKEG